MQPSHFRIAQLSISALCLAFGVAIMGTAGHTLEIYRSQYTTNPWWLPLWNSHFDVRGTNTLIGAGATATFTNLVFITACLLPKLNLANRITLRAFITIALALPTVVVTFVIFIYVQVLNKGSPDVETIQTWTCKFKNKKPLSSDISVSSSISNDDFAALCAESKFALYTTLVVFLLQGIMMVVALLTWCVEKWAARKQRKWQDVDSVEMNAPGSDEPKEQPQVHVHATQSH